jgi:hypothetical protein
VSQTIKLKELKLVEFVFEVTNINTDIILMVTSCYILYLL